MTFSCPSFSAAATRLFMPPRAAAEVAALASTAAVVLLLVAELPTAAVLLVVAELDELPQPAISKMDPTAAAVATIALDARKVKPSPCRPGGMWGELGILARQVVILANQL